jgi:gluconokinase
VASPDPGIIAGGDPISTSERPPPVSATTPTAVPDLAAPGGPPRQGFDPVILVLMGVCGSGKSTVGEALAASLGWQFLDADDFHPPANVAKMASGAPLTDDDRWPWLDRIADELRAVLARGGHAVLACSALKAAYRERLQRAGDVRIVYLAGDAATLAARLAMRQHKYMPPTLLPSQLATLEEPADALRIDIRDAVPVQVQAIREAFGLATMSGGAA